MNEFRNQEITCEIKLNITKEIVEDILCGAFEGGITGWCCGISIPEEDQESNDCQFFHEHLTNGGSTLYLHDNEEDTFYVLTQDKVINGIKKFFENNPTKVVLDYETQLLDTTQIDGIDCDCIIQYALFNEVIYG